MCLEAARVSPPDIASSQSQSGAVARETEDVDLNAVVAEIAELYAPAFEEAGARLDVVMPEGPVRILGARALISQAIANLVENALKYACMPKHAITLELSRRATQTGVFFDISCYTRTARLQSAVLVIAMWPSLCNQHFLFLLLC